jgi:hypothetical protein
VFDLGFRLSPAVGGVIGIAMMALGVISDVASIVISGAVVATAASGRFISRH